MAHLLKLGLIEANDWFRTSLVTMKKALLLALAGVLAAAAPALAHPPAPANVNFTSERGVPFGLVLDGRVLTRGVARQVHVDRLMPGLHWADFSVPTPYGRAVRYRSRVWLEAGLETSFVLVTRPGRPLSLRQVGAVVLCGPGYGPGRSNGRNGRQYDDDGYGEEGHHDFDDDDGYGQAPAGYLSTPSGHDHGASNAYDNGSSYSNGPGYPTGNGTAGQGGYGTTAGGTGYYPGSAVSSYRLLPPQDVDALVQAVEQRPFEASKLSIAKETLSQSSIEARDLQRLLRGLEFEASRVELAKYAYPHVADRQNFYQVYEAFQFDASTQEVQRAVAGMASQ